MEPRRRNAVLIGIFAILLALHLWLIARSLSRGDALLAAILGLAVAVFVQRIVHHVRQARGATVPPRRDERSHILLWSAILLTLVPIHGLLLLRFLEQGDLLLSSLLAVAIAALGFRLVWYGWKYRTLPDRSGLSAPDRAREAGDLRRG